MSKDLKKPLQAFKDIDGFMAVGVFSPEGEMVADLSNGEVKLNEVGALANDILLKAQKATDVMGVGRGNFLHVIAPQANIFARCLNESTDFAAHTAGRAHIHMVAVFSPEANVALAKMRMQSVIGELAEFFR